MDEKPNKLTPEQVKKTEDYSIVDGCGFNVMYGFGEQYITPYALKLGANNTEIAAITSVPSFVGSLFQVVGANIADKYHDRKKIVVWFTFLHAISLIPLFLVPLFTKNILLLTIIFSLYQLFANIPGPAWNSWIGDIVPEDKRSAYFSRRNSVTVAALFFSILIAGTILNYFSEVNIWLGFGILFGVSFLGRIISWIALMKHYEPKYSPNYHYFSLKEFLERMPKTNFGNFAIFRSLMGFAVMISGPFYTVYMLKDLNCTYLHFTIITLVPMIIKVFTMSYWGKYSNRFGNRNIMFVSSILISMVPLLWFLSSFFDPINAFYYLICIECLTGFSWAGFELTTFNYMLETVHPQKRARAFAYFNVLFGLTVMIGGLLGAFILQFLEYSTFLKTTFSAIAIVFLVSAFARFMITITFMKKMREMKVERTIDETKLIYDLAIARPLSAALHQTHAIMLYAEKQIQNIQTEAEIAVSSISEPIQPVMKHSVETLKNTTTKNKNKRHKKK